MQPLIQGKLERPPVKEWIAKHVSCNVSRNEAKKRYAEYGLAEVWFNDIYLVLIHRHRREYVWISLRRHDKQPMVNWTDMQEIKNQLVGTECEMVQLFPAESRKVDMVNQYHMFGYNSPAKRFPFGFEAREVNLPTL
jgi:hypothetical protein